ncbi:MAG: SDR family NAD(P)-dependent oxidoreductase [Balneolaceae bacterium]|nr:SDR family NAD(P)-dependent oxidoreductase [Balneolaceae bacterium]
MKTSEPKKPEYNLFSNFFGSFFILPADLRYKINSYGSVNRKALVTGGSSGIGKETARQLVEAGGEVVIAARGKERLEEAADEIGAIPIPCDVSSEKDGIDLRRSDHRNV